MLRAFMHADLELLVKCYCVVNYTEMLKLSATTVTVISTGIVLMARLCQTQSPALQLVFALKKAICMYLFSKEFSLFIGKEHVNRNDHREPVLKDLYAWRHEQGSLPES